MTDPEAPPEPLPEAVPEAPPNPVAMHCHDFLLAAVIAAAKLDFVCSSCYVLSKPPHDCIFDAIVTALDTMATDWRE